MNPLILTKFTIATPENIDIVHELSKAIAYEKFSNLVEANVLEQYITTNFNKVALKDEMNSMSNQWLTVYCDTEAAGFARITSKGIKPEIFGDKRIVRLADYGILNKFKDTEANQSLFDKCVLTCKSYEGIWLNEYQENPLLDFFERNDFTRKDYSEDSFELPLSSVYLIRDRSNVAV